MTGYSCARCGRVATRNRDLYLSPEIDVTIPEHDANGDRQDRLTGRMICSTCWEADDYRDVENRHPLKPMDAEHLRRLLKRSPLS